MKRSAKKYEQDLAHQTALLRQNKEFNEIISDSMESWPKSGYEFTDNQHTGWLALAIRAGDTDTVRMIQGQYQSVQSQKNLLQVEFNKLLKENLPITIVKTIKIITYDMTF